MKKYKAFVLLTSLISLLAICLWLSGAALAQNSTVEVRILPPVQNDACSNLVDMQIAIPRGYYQDMDGNCHLQPASPVAPIDVCPNIDDLQDEVPSGYVNEANGDCIKPIDMCPNIKGQQSMMPSGMKKDQNGDCLVLALQSATGVSKGGGGSFKNIPTLFEPIIAPLVNLFPESIRAKLHSVPTAVSKSFPYVTFTGVVLMATIMLFQSIAEAHAYRQLSILLARDRNFAEEKDNFLMLASHYMLTPISLMKNGIELASGGESAIKDAVAPLQASVTALKERIDTILQGISDNTALKGIVTDKWAGLNTSFIRSVTFWIPVIASLSLTIIANFLLGVVGNVDLGATNLWRQLIVFMCVTGLLYAVIRNHQIRQHRRKYAKSLLEHEYTIDEARTKFIKDAADALKSSLDSIGENGRVLNGSPYDKYFASGYERLTDMAAKFTLLGQVQTGVLRETQEFDIGVAINSVLANYSERIAEKQLSITNSAGGTVIQQNRVLFDFVLHSVIDNAVKFCDTNGSIEIATSASEHQIKVTVSDNGVGIPDDKLSELFKPFSRIGSAAHFDYEGLGFSLFLDKIIMDYAGGTIAAESAPHGGTNLIVAAPINAVPQQAV